MVSVSSRGFWRHKLCAETSNKNRAIGDGASVDLQVIASGSQITGSPDEKMASSSARMALGSDERKLAIDKMQLFIADFMVEWKQAGGIWLWFMFRFYCSLWLCDFCSWRKEMIYHLLISLLDMANRCGLFALVLHTDRSLEQRGAFTFLPGYSWCDLQKWGPVLGICSLRVTAGAFKDSERQLKPGRRGEDAWLLEDHVFWFLVRFGASRELHQAVLHNKHGRASVQRRPS